MIEFVDDEIELTIEFIKQGRKERKSSVLIFIFITAGVIFGSLVRLRFIAFLGQVEYPSEEIVDVINFETSLRGSNLIRGG